MIPEIFFQTGAESTNRFYLQSQNRCKGILTVITDVNEKRQFLFTEMMKAEIGVRNFETHFMMMGRDVELLYEGAVLYRAYVQGLYKALRAGDKNAATVTTDDRLNLTGRLLIIYYLCRHDLFPHYQPQNGQTKKQFEKKVADMVSANLQAVKTGFQRVDKIVACKGLTRGNKNVRMRQLKNAVAYFEKMGKPEIVQEVEKLILKVSKKEF